MIIYTSVYNPSAHTLQSIIYTPAWQSTINQICFNYLRNYSRAYT